MGKKLSKIKKRKNEKKSKYEITVQYFSNLEKHELLEMEFMLNKGGCRVEIIEQLRNRPEFKDLADRTLELRLIDYNTLVLKPKLMESIDDVDVYAELLSLKDKVNVLKEFTLLVHHQKQRVVRKIEFERLQEKESGSLTIKVSDQVRKEIKVLSDILEKLAKVQLETGVLKRAPRTLTGELYNEGEDGKTSFKMTEQFDEVFEAINVEFAEILKD